MTKTLLLTLCLGSAAAFAQTPVATGGTPVVGIPSQGMGTITPSTCTGSLVSNGIKADGTVNCVTPTASITPGSDAPLGVVTTKQLNGSYGVDKAASGAGNDGFTQVLTNQCAGTCDIVAPTTYTKTDLSNYFVPAKDGVQDLYARFPGAGLQIDVPRFVEDRRLGNRYWTAINPQPLVTSIYSDRTPFVYEHRTSNSIGYGYNQGLMLLRMRGFDGGHNYLSTRTDGGNNTQKSNFNMLVLDGIVSYAGQGGSIFGGSIIHAAQGDLMWRSAVVNTMGASETEDERTKSARDFYGTTTMRFGGTTSAAPTVVNADGFGLATFHVNQTTGYRNDVMAGGDMPLVNLSQIYSGSSADAFLQSSYPGFARIPIRDASTVASQFGTSAFTTLTADISNVTYDGNCPATVLNANPLATDPMILNAQGQGGMRVCATVGSTSGMSSGMRFSIGGLKSNFEIALVDTVVDATHVWVKVKKYHQAGEAVAINGAQGTAFSLPSDDIAVGAMPGYGQPLNGKISSQQTTLHKYWYTLGNDATSLYVYLDGAFSLPSPELSTTAYQSTTPLASATLGTAVLSGTALSSIPVTAGGNYSGPTAGANVAVGQATFAVPIVTVDPAGSACSAKPLAHAVYGIVNYTQTVVSVAIDAAGTCQSVPTVTMQTLWSNPYRLAPATVTEKVVDPANGSPSMGYLLTDPVDFSKWPSGSAVEIPGWMHDDAAGNKSYGKYFTGRSTRYGFKDYTEFQGNYAGPDTLIGVTNATDGHAYYADATHPIGPGVAYEQPPDLMGIGGDHTQILHSYYPPADALLYAGCGDAPGGRVIYHPCKDGILAPYNIFHAHSDVTGSNFDYQLKFNPKTGSLSWNGGMSFLSANLTSLNVAGPSVTTQLSVGDGTVGAYNPQNPQANIVAGNMTVLNGFFGSGLGFSFCGQNQLPTAAVPCTFIGGLEISLDETYNFYSKASLTIANHNSGTIATRVPYLGAWEDGVISIGLDGAHCTSGEVLCNANDSWASDASGNLRSASLTLGSQPTITCSSSAAGRFNYVAGPSGTKDTVEVCAKDASNTYAWRVIY